MSAPPAVRVYANLRTAHLERFEQMAQAEVIYRSTRYDFDPSVASGRISLTQLGRIGVLRRVMARPYRVIEINEPIMFERWADLLALMFVVRVRDLITRRRTSIVSYAIGLTDPVEALHRRRRVPRPVGRAVTRLAMSLLVRGIDRLAFGTSGCRDLYAAYVGSARLQASARVFEAVPGRCGCVADPAADVERRPDTLLFVGAFDDRKGIAATMRAWDALRRDRPDTRFVVIGKGPRLDEVKTWAASRPEVSLLVDPPRPEVHAALREATVLVLLSQRIGAWREQVGLPIVEALAHGCAVVTTSETGLARWLGDHGHTVVAPDLEPAGVAAALAEAFAAARPAESILADLPELDSRIAADDWLMDTGAAR